MAMMRMRSVSEPEVLVSGRNLGLSLVAAICGAAGVGMVTYYGLATTMGRLLGTTLPQIVTFAVYATLVAILCYAFRPPSRPQRGNHRPLPLRRLNAIVYSAIRRMELKSI